MQDMWALPGFDQPKALWGDTPHGLSLNSRAHSLTFQSPETGSFYLGPLLTDTFTPLEAGHVAAAAFSPNQNLTLAIGPDKTSRVHIRRSANSNYEIFINGKWWDMSNQIPVIFGTNPNIEGVFPQKGINATQIKLNDDPGMSPNQLAIREFVDSNGYKGLLLQNLSASTPISIRRLVELGDDPTDASQRKSDLYTNRAGGIEFAYALNQGKHRKNQQDNARAVPVVINGHEAAFGIVADGMGGYSGGVEAAKTCIDMIPSEFQKNIANGMNTTEALKNALLATQQYMIDNKLEGGATVAGAILDKVTQTATLFHVGDARTYIAEKKTLSQIGKDHSLVQILIDGRQISERQRRTHPQRNQVAHSISPRDDQLGALLFGNPDDCIQTIPLPPTVLLCSDGLWEEVPNTAPQGYNIQDILNTAANPAQTADRLTQAALFGDGKDGGKDNIGVLVLNAA